MADDVVTHSVKAPADALIEFVSILVGEIAFIDCFNEAGNGLLHHVQRRCFERFDESL